MSIADKKFIDVLNYNNNIVVVTGMNDHGHSFAPGDYNSPSVIPMTIEDISYINSRSPVFKDGVLRFRDDEHNEICEYLGIREDDMLFNEWIEDAIRNPDSVKLNKILAITKSAQFERVRGCYYSLLNAGEDLSVKVGRLIEARYDEIYKGKLHTALVVTSNDGSAKSEASSEIADLQAKIDAQNKQIEKYQAMLDQLFAEKSANAEAAAPVKNTRSRKKSAETTEAKSDN